MRRHGFTTAPPPSARFCPHRCIAKHFVHRTSRTRFAFDGNSFRHCIITLLDMSLLSM